jgi:hypothetical protein
MDSMYADHQQEPVGSAECVQYLVGKVADPRVNSP